MTALRKTQVALISDAAPFAIRAERASDVVVREALLDAGENRLIAPQRNSQCLSHRLTGKVVFSGPQTAAENQDL